LKCMIPSTTPWKRSGRRLDRWFSDSWLGKL
jgi:hypothetical protein